MLQINKADVTKVYSGKAKTCCCGCAGTYWDNNEDNARQVERIINKVQDSAQEDLDVCSTYAAVEIGSRLYIVYFD